MNATDKRIFINELTGCVVRNALHRVPDMPEEWDGHELRQYIVDCFKAEARPILLVGKRRRNYVNTVAVKNL
jgi:hypothetical protein